MTTAIELERQLAAFDQAWQRGTAPPLEDFLLGPGASAGRTKLLHELVKIDLEYRWRGGAGAKLEDYIRRFPELAQPCVSADLIGEEYRARQRWGDRPAHTEYQTRFPQLGPELRQVLERIDAALKTEYVPRSQAPAALALASQAALVPAPVSSGALLDALRRLQLLSAAQVEAAGALLAKFPEPRTLARELLQRGWLTAYQVNQVLQGRAAELVVGPHILLERIGEGGTGQVFKARHQHMDRVVAVKLIRKDLLTDPEVVSRFQREVRVVSQLTHPNVVVAYDAGPIGNGYYLAMELVEGTDLMRRVKQQGPLPLEAACSFIRQAALGLQHIHERGLVHRDIKPSNLIVTGASTIKVLDLGLARLQRPIDEAGAALTANGAVLVGTVDYMAPEQALNFHDVDHRADLYSLGATFYFLLTGQPPFPGGTMAQKLLRQQQATPTPVEHLRPEVSPAVALVVRRMMARRPDDRFASAAAVVQALPAQTAPLATIISAHAGHLQLPAPQALPAAITPKFGLPRLPALLRRLSGRRSATLAATVLLLLGIVLWWLFGEGAGEREAYLSDMQEMDVVVAKGTNFGKNGKTQADGVARHVVVAGVPSPKGLYTEPPYNGAGHVSYRLGKKYRRFETAVGLNDSMSFGHILASFTVVGDGKTLWSSDKLPNGKTQKCQVDVTGVDVLELFATGGGHPVWIEPKVFR